MHSLTVLIIKIELVHTWCVCNESNIASYQFATTLLTTITFKRAQANCCRSTLSSIPILLELLDAHITHSDISSPFRHVLVSLRAPSFSAFQNWKGCITPFSTHCSKWSRMDVPSFLPNQYSYRQTALQSLVQYMLSKSR